LTENVVTRPLTWFVWALPFRWRETTGRWAKGRKVAAVWSVMTLPLFVWLLHGSTLWAWHVPYLYDASVEHDWVHALQHTTFLFTALLFWWTLIQGRYGRISYGVGVIYVFTTAIHTSILGALMTFTNQLWYPIYEGRTSAFHLTPIEDQQLGGLIMWIPAGVIFIVLGLWLMSAWLRESEKRVSYTRVEEVQRSA
jgi:putative membrane protein